MKVLRRILPVFLIFFMGAAFWSCDDDNNDEPLSPDQLPAMATSFINTYFPAASIESAITDDGGYEVVLSDGTTIDFNSTGEWQDVDAPVGMTVPIGFYPAEIDNYIAANADSFGSTGINEISKEFARYEVELLNGLDLYFGLDGSFITYD
ncbi:MAG: PepSY-like domain-containing protein [Duncaniella sp.]|nr:PepSY-like domain-containing protein [Duncaniella sp.]